MGQMAERLTRETEEKNNKNSATWDTHCCSEQHDASNPESTRAVEPALRQEFIVAENPPLPEDDRERHQGTPGSRGYLLLITPQQEKRCESPEGRRRRDAVERCPKPCPSVSESSSLRANRALQTGSGRV